MEVFLKTCGLKRVRTLLVLSLLVLKAAAECPKPEGGENIVLTDDALLKNHYEENSEVTLECGNGYETESGSGVITCIDEKWSEPDLICRKKDCGAPKPQPSMTFDMSGGTLFGALIRVICDKGYQVSGSSFKQCYASGWVGRTQCEVVTCDKPGEVTNGRNSWDSEEDPEYEAVIQYTCDPGFSLTGNATIRCTETGLYDSEPPECQGVKADDKTTTVTVTHRPTTPTQEHQDTDDAGSLTTTTPTVPPAPQGSRDIMTAEEKTTPTAVKSTTALQDQHNATLDKTAPGVGYLPVIISVISVSLAVCLCLFVVQKFLMKKKGSYDTREDLKPELLQFQNL
ncbi:complement decay-accelerating factor isoform X3 [Xyrichtys novacula]|uniref:Complement decay-accelerating factor isoform X3 n=1 Tax=Xyrichtys novacula TaxID=13765 RepID=A0AAV1END8_XYRNO|nr:complement decay-accelerating factor isoform X3 [Xyrichtys novacula]